MSSDFPYDRDVDHAAQVAYNAARRSSPPNPAAETSKSRVSRSPARRPQSSSSSKRGQSLSVPVSPDDGVPTDDRTAADSPDVDREVGPGSAGSSETTDGVVPVVPTCRKGHIFPDLCTAQLCEQRDVARALSSFRDRFGGRDLALDPKDVEERATMRLRDARPELRVIALTHPLEDGPVIRLFVMAGASKTGADGYVLRLEDTDAVLARLGF